MFLCASKTVYCLQTETILLFLVALKILKQASFSSCNAVCVDSAV